ncbi:MAG: SufD family Fe-S cluster assembly protein [Coprobacillus sp.]
MTNYTLNSQYYLIIENGNIKDSQLPVGVTYNQDILTFSTHDSIEIQVIFLLNNYQQTITYQFEKHVVVDIIETRILDQQSSLHKTMNLDENATVHIFHENNSINNETVSCFDDVNIKRDATIQSAYAELSDGSCQCVYRYYLDGENAEAKIRMAILSKQKENKTYEVLIQHNQPHTYGQMDNYGVVKEQGKLVIDGIGTITKGQHGSSSHQTNKIMVFDPECIASANPYLYIDEFDVKASHAAGVGKMDEEHLYYLQSRGLTKKQAMQLITYGYLKPVIEVVDNPMLKEQFENVLSKVGA